MGTGTPSPGKAVLTMCRQDRPRRWRNGQRGKPCTAAMGSAVTREVADGDEVNLGIWDGDGAGGTAAMAPEAEMGG